MTRRRFYIDTVPFDLLYKYSQRLYANDDVDVKKALAL